MKKDIYPNLIKGLSNNERKALKFLAEVEAGKYTFEEMLEVEKYFDTLLDNTISLQEKGLGIFEYKVDNDNKRVNITLGLTDLGHTALNNLIEYEANH